MKEMKESMTDAEKKELEKISDELKGASKMHASQSKRVKKIVDSSKEISENEKKNCGCGKDPCVTYGVQSESAVEEADLKNKDKADLDDDGKLSSYEKKRGKAIEKSIEKQKKKSLKESLFGPRDTRLFEKLLSEWTKK